MNEGRGGNFFWKGNHAHARKMSCVKSVAQRSGKPTVTGLQQHPILNTLPKGKKGVGKKIGKLLQTAAEHRRGRSRFKERIPGDLLGSRVGADILKKMEERKTRILQAGYVQT